MIKKCFTISLALAVMTAGVPAYAQRSLPSFAIDAAGNVGAPGGGPTIGKVDPTTKVFTPSIPPSIALPGAPTTTTPAVTDNSDKIATTKAIIAAIPGTNILTRGADLTGAADSSAAFAAAIANDPEILIPPGNYSLKSLVTATVSHPVHIRGAGRGATLLVANNPNGCLNITQTDAASPVSITGISCIAGSAGANGTAISITYPLIGSNQFSGLILNDVDIQGGNFGSWTFANGLFLTNAWNAYVHDVTITGATGSPGLMTNGILLACGSLAFHANHISIYAAQNAVTTADASCDSAGQRIEGLDFSKFEMVNVGTCFNLQHPSNTPGNFIHDGHCNATAVGFNMVNQDQMNIHDLTMYRSLPNNNWVGFSLVTSNDNDIHDNKLLTPGGPGTGSPVGIALISGIRNRIHNNDCTYWAVTGVCIWLNGAADFSRIHDNNADQASAAVTSVLLQTTGLHNLLTNNYPIGPQGIANNSVTPSVANALGPQWGIAYSAATTITNLLNGYNGQRVDLVASTGNASVANGANILLKGNTSTTIPNGGVLSLVFSGTVWVEVSRNY